MSRIENDNLILSKEETRKFLNSIINPGPERIYRMKKYFTDVDNMVISTEEDGSVTIKLSRDII